MSEYILITGVILSIVDTRLRLPTERPRAGVIYLAVCLKSVKVWPSYV